jgi:phosphoglycolate phosphatase-like HAD superfamily hydrolase
VVSDGVVVFDLDGVLADTRHRDHYLNGDPEDWDAYFAACVHDQPVSRMIALAEDLVRHYRIVVATGRPNRIRPETERWLDLWHVPWATIYTRGDSDRRPNAQLKVDQAREINCGRIAFWVDDNPAVADALAPYGVPVMLVRPERDLADLQAAT